MPCYVRGFFIYARGMIIYQGAEHFSVSKPVVTIGMFDGVHQGHRSVLQYISERAKQIGGASVLLSFWPHPRMCFEGENTKLRYLNTLEEKKLLLSSLSLDHLVIQPFSEQFSTLTPEEYVKSILTEKLRAHTVIVGYDHNFGHKGSGDFETLKKLSSVYGFSVEQLPPLAENGTNISSTKIRNLLYSGDIEVANRFLSYNYFVSGIVEPGNKLGRTIGFPTANIATSNPMKLIPHTGVYAIQSVIDGEEHCGVMNIGFRPTIGQNLKQTIEAHFFNFNGDLYGKSLRIEFRTKIREELKFDGIETLKKQIEADIVRAKRFFSTGSCLG